MPNQGLPLAPLRIVANPILNVDAMPRPTTWDDETLLANRNSTMSKILGE